MVNVVTPPVPKYVVCPNCKAGLEYVASDVSTFKSTDYTGCTDIDKVIVCPSCNSKINVN